MGTSYDRPDTQRRCLTGLLVPSDGAGPCRLVQVDDRSAVISDVLGGGAIDEVISGSVDGHLITVYARESGGLTNTRAGTIAARLGYEARDVQRRLSGHVLITGQDPTGTRDVDVPRAVLGLVTASGIEIFGVRAGDSPR
jgi:hypothetical protein